MAIDVRNIPRIMRSKGWVNGATLQDIWFSRPAAIKPAFGPAETATIKMDWVLKYDRARTVYDTLMRNRIWANPAAQEEFTHVLERKGLLLSSSAMFGMAAAGIEVQDADSINFLKVGLAADLDDLSAALFRFVFRVVVYGTVSPLGGGHNYHRGWCLRERFV